MRIRLALLTLLLVLLAVVPAGAEQGPSSDAIMEKMAVKLIRGITNVVTCIVELPKQTYLTIASEGAVGVVVGPVKGVGMTLYRGILGAGETVFFMVPQPGYYDPMIDPDYVWKGWDVKAQSGGQ